MKKLLAIVSIVCSLFAFGPAATAKQSMPISGPFVWVGLDYSQVRLIGPEFKDPEAIFPGFFETWNNLFLRERMRAIEKETKQDFTADIEAVTAANKTATSKQVIDFPGRTTPSPSLTSPASKSARW
jgi:hypothetical protein